MSTILLVFYALAQPRVSIRCEKLNNLVLLSFTFAGSSHHLAGSLMAMLPHMVSVFDTSSFYPYALLLHLLLW